MTLPSRVVFPLNQRWLYCSEHKPEHLSRECDESGFAPVTIPHANIQTPYSGFDDRMYQFVSSYRRHFRLPPEHRGKRVFVDFDGAMTAAAIAINGKVLEEHRGGYVPFSFDLTDFIDWNGDNTLSVRLDSTERSDIPPFGGRIDYLTYGGIYREVRLRLVNPVFIESLFVKPQGIVEGDGRVVFLARIRNTASEDSKGNLRVQISDRRGTVGEIQGACRIPAQGEAEVLLEFQDTGGLKLWTLEEPELYRVDAVLECHGVATDSFNVRFGYREARFTPEGFHLNGRRIHLRGLNRHQAFPWVGYAMPARVQRRDADILKYELKANIVRTSHYPQSPHFLDRCDEIGLLVLEEIPGWQHIGNADWKDLSCRDVEAMIRRDFNHPSIVLWGVRINESLDDDAFYARTNRIAHALDDTRQTGGIRGHWVSNLLEDVFTFNDFDPERLRTPEHPLYLVTEFCGHMYPTKHFDNLERLTEHSRRHAHIHSCAATTPGISGAIAWCAFDYNTHCDFGSGDRICHHGVCDMFRIPKYAAGFYRSQCDPAEEIVLEPAFPWCMGDYPGGGIGEPIVHSNCDRLELFLDEEYVGEILPEREAFPGLAHPPFFVRLPVSQIWGSKWRSLRIDGFVGSRKAISKTLSDKGVDSDFILAADDTGLLGDGRDMTRVWFRVTDEFGNPRNFAVGVIWFDIEGPGEIIGDNPFALIGGCGAIWIRSKPEMGIIWLTATHPTLGKRKIWLLVQGPRTEKV